MLGIVLKFGFYLKNSLENQCFQGCCPCKVALEKFAPVWRRPISIKQLFHNQFQFSKFPFIGIRRRWHYPCT